MNCSFYIVFINGISEWSLELRTSNFDYYGREARNVQGTAANENTSSVIYGER
jgi:hypothetical protein